MNTTLKRMKHCLVGSILRQCLTRKFTLLRVTRTSGIPTVGNLTETNLISENPELRVNLTEILTELWNFRYKRNYRK